MHKHPAAPSGGMQTVLIAEDDDALRMGLALDLRKEGYRILEAASGEQALALAEEETVHLALLDVNLPGRDGFTLCRELKQRADIPVIFLTARDLEQDEIIGFEAGADDYITKPFRMGPVRKRISAVLRRSGPGLGYSDGFLTIDFENGTVVRDGNTLRLTPTENKLLSVMVANSGKVMTRRLLLEKLWDNDGNFVDEHALTVNVNRLRGKLEDTAHKYIKTIHGMGYLWEPRKGT